MLSATVKNVTFVLLTSFTSVLAAQIRPPAFLARSTSTAGIMQRVSQNPALTVSNGNNPPVFLLRLIASFDTFYGSALIVGNDGQLYGAGDQCCGNYGVVFSVDPSTGQFTVLHTFDGSDGSKPLALLQGIDGNFYGVTEQGGLAGCTNGCGEILKLDASSPHNLNVIHQFQGSGTDGYQPYYLVQGSDGYLYGLAYEGVGSPYGEIFKCDTLGNNFTILYTFDGSDGSQPTALLPPYGGVLYGVEPTLGQNGNGEVFAINSDGSNFTIIHAFTDGSDGANPDALVRTSGGALYGVASAGPPYAPGELFRVNSDDSVTVLHSFAENGSEGTDPNSLSYVQTSIGPVLLGTACCGGTGNAGTIFEYDIVRSNFTVVYSFSGGPLDPNVPLVQAPNSEAIYGTTAGGGMYESGVVFQFNFSPTLPPGSTPPTMWQTLGPANIQRPGSLSAAGKLQAVVVDNQNPSVMYAGGGIGPGNSGPYTEAGVYKTVDGGSTWAQVNAGLTDPAVDALWLSQESPSTVVVGTNSTGIFRSTDGGGHWTLRAQYGATTSFLQVGGTLYAATAQGVVSSTDSGATWSMVKSTMVPARALAAGGGLIYAGLDNGQVLVYSSGIWTTTVPTANGTVWSITVNPNNSQNAFVVEWNGYQTPDLYVTQNGGSSWNPDGTISCPVQVAAFDAITGVLYAGCDGQLWKSSDDGGSWSQLTSASWDVRLIVTDFAGVSGHIAVGSDQGIYFSQDSGNTWHGLNGNITSSILFAVAVQGSTILTTAQDFSPISSFDGGQTWSNLESGAAVGESGTVLFNSGNPTYAYVFTTNGFYFSSNGARSFTLNTTLSGSEFPQGAGNGDLIAVDATNPSTVYVVAVDGVYKSVNWGASWVRQSWLPISQPDMVAVDPSNSNHIFVGEQSGQLMVSSDGGAHWATSNLGCSSCGSPVALAVSTANPQIVLLGMSQPPPNGGILRSTDGGADFAPSNSGIVVRTTQCQAAAVPHVRFDPSGSGIIAAAVNSGLYLSTDLGNDWFSISGSAVPDAFTDVVWSRGGVYVSSCGEGVLRTLFFLP